MSEELRYKQDKCLVCGKLKILKDDICLDCDGGDEFVNKLYKFIKNIETRILCENTEQNLITLIKSYEQRGWMRLFPITFTQSETKYWYFKTVVVKEKNSRGINEA